MDQCSEISVVIREQHQHFGLSHDRLNSSYTTDQSDAPAMTRERVKGETKNTACFLRLKSPSPCPVWTESFPVETKR